MQDASAAKVLTVSTLWKFKLVATIPARGLQDSNCNLSFSVSSNNRP